MNRGKSSLAKSLLLTNFGRFCLPTRRLITREEKENSITIDSFNQIPRIRGGRKDELGTRIVLERHEGGGGDVRRREGEKDDENGK